MDHEYIRFVIREYADECLKEPAWRLSREGFKRFSYSRWAVDEILKSMEDSKFTPPVIVVKDFIRKMDEFSHRNNRTNMIFSVAHDMAENVLDVLIAME